jgi:hypothetical protein
MIGQGQRNRLRHMFILIQLLFYEATQGMLLGQGFGRRIPNYPALTREVTAWQSGRNAAQYRLIGSAPPLTPIGTHTTVPDS